MRNDFGNRPYKSRFPYRSGLKKGKSAGKKKQGYAAREDESLGMRTGKESTKKQSFKARRDESYGAWGKRKSGKVPWYVGAGGKNPGKRKDIVITHSKIKKTEKIDAAEKQVKEGKQKLKDLVGSGQAKEMKDYKGKSTGRHFRTGSR